MRLFKRDKPKHNCPECGKEQKGKTDGSYMHDLCWDCLGKGTVGELASQQIDESRLDALSKLQKDWDAHGSDAPSMTAIANARKFLHYLKDDPIHIGPSVEGGVGVTVGHFYIEFHNDGDMLGIKMADTLLLSVKKSDIK